MNLLYKEDELYIYCFPYFPVNSNMYLIFDGEDAIIIDPNNNSDIDIILSKHDIKEITVLLTHGDFDHINGLPFLEEKYQLNVICHKLCAQRIKDIKNNRPLLVLRVLSDRFGKESNEYLCEKKLYKPFCYEANITFDDYYEFNFRNHIFKLIYTPGHTKDSCCIEYDDKIIFSGDTFLLDSSVVTKFKHSDAQLYKNYALTYAKNILPEMIIFPGHGTPFKIKEFLNYSEVLYE